MLLGVEGFVMMLFGFTDAIASLYLGKLAGQVGRTPVRAATKWLMLTLCAQILLAGSAMHLSCLCAILWMPLNEYSNLKVRALLLMLVAYYCDCNPHCCYDLSATT